MRNVLFFTTLLLSLSAFGADSSLDKVKKLKNMLKSYPSEYQEVRTWAGQGFKGNAPATPKKLKQIIKYLGVYYGKLAQETNDLKYAKAAKTFTKVSDKLSEVQTADVPMPIEDEFTPAAIERPRTKKAQASSKGGGVTVDAGIIRIPVITNVTAAGVGTDKITTAFQGYSLGIGYRSPGETFSWDSLVAVYMLNGKLSATSFVYEQDSAVLKGAFGYYGPSYFVSDKFSLGAKLGAALQSLTVTKTAGVETKLQSSFSPVGVLSAEWWASQSFTLQGQFYYWNGIGFGASGAYHF